MEVPSEVDLREMARLDYEAQRQETSDRLRYQVEFSQSALKNLILVNGGAVIALFTFIGHDGSKFDIHQLWWSFAIYCAGLICALSAYILAFFSQLYFMNASAYQMWNSQRRMVGQPELYDVMAEAGKGNRALRAALTISIVGLISFLVGSAFAMRGVL